MNIAAQVLGMVSSQNPTVGAPSLNQSQTLNPNPQNPVDNLLSGPQDTSDNQPFAALLDMLASALGTQAQNTELTTENPPTAVLSNFNVKQETTAVQQQINGQKSQSPEEKLAAASGLNYLNLVSLIFTPVQTNNILDTLPTTEPGKSPSGDSKPSGLIPKVESDGSGLQEILAVLSGGNLPAAGDNSAPFQISANLYNALKAYKEQGAGQSTAPIVSNPVLTADLEKLANLPVNGTTDSNFADALKNLLPQTQNVKSEDANSILQNQNIKTPTVPNAVPAGKSPAGQVLSNLQSAIPVDAKILTQPLTDKAVQAQIVSVESTNKDPNGAVVAASAPISTSATVKSADGSTNQSVDRLNGINANQNSPGIKSSSAPGKQNSTKSDSDLSDLLKRSIAGTASNVSDGIKTDSSFKQVLSNVSQNPPGADVKPNALQIAQSIVREVNMMAQDGKTVMRLKLEPELLGTVVLKAVSEDGKVSAEFNVRTPDARAYLEASIPQMKQMLQSNGVSLTHLTVNLSGGESQTKHSQYQLRKQSQKFYGSLPSDSNEAARSFGYNTMEVKV